jgi:hypothetical protein
VKLRLQEDPRAWRKFGLSSALVLALIDGWLWRRGAVPGSAAWTVLAALLVAALVAWRRPAWLRGPYRAGMRLSHVLGRVIAPVVLGLIFFLVLVPIGLLLRLMRKDLLELKRRTPSESYWQPCSGSDDLAKMF